MSGDTTIDAAAAVDFVLKSKGLPVTAEERENLIKSYPIMMEMAAGLRIPEVRYGEPAVIYPA